MTKITIRKAKVSELQQLLEIEQLIIDSERVIDPNIKVINCHFYDIKKLLSSDDALVLVGVLDNQIVATGLAMIKQSEDYLNDDFHAFLGFMYVDPDYRGKAINKLMTEKLIDWSRQKNMTVICLEVLNGNDAAIKSYSKSGFSKNLTEMRLNL